ncbi:NUDIX hydrolase [Nonomuraea roseoviolacea]|uniref:8-oxo-dGTP diphosphatase n=1 Tax=Nonomuraea roseoviolacea subsp. carminata TaxID=160689 RepID=A0ABT1K3U8_9ACTN|nr:NUDIX domain-containing protein [Nonomuraea roseoviolacea]MCP2348156.1 8-oxo-dGTP diphosphatase [Nonomuraea roseoviolacea subsp. carminata]
MTDDGWEPPSVLLAVDLVILTLRDARLHVLLVERGVEPYQGAFALPGGFLHDEGEAIEAAARRELAEEAGLFDVHLEVIGVYGEPGRDPRGRVVSVSHLAIAPRLPDPIAGTDAVSACWTPVEDVLSIPAHVKLAFDHRRILADGVERARTKLEHTSLATAFCGETFTISELQQVYEAVWGVGLDPRNFYRKVQNARGFIVAAGPMRRPQNGRPARLFKAGPIQALYPPMVRSAQIEHTVSGGHAVEIAPEGGERT